ncbi:hypothetical protein [Aquipuribacter sp. MA13-6]|uniref:hypothetical protein n=1 Tax=unclassified Aquipuribacter TaxID=2635084 RepID=UPI003EEB9E34
MAAAEDGLERYVAAVACPFARQARIVRLDVLRQRAASPIQDVRSLRDFLSRHDDQDAFDVIAAPLDVKSTDSLSLLAKRFREFVEMSYREDGSVLAPSEVEQFDWQFSICGTRFFMLVLSPVYSVSHPRHIASECSWVLLQTERAFTQMMPRTRYSHADRDGIKTKIRAAFERVGKGYYGSDERPRQEAARYIMSADPIDRVVVEWWKA